MSVSGTEPASPGWEERSLDRSLSAARDRSSVRARRLVDGARRLASSGSTSFTVADVAAEAGVSLRSFYRHFGGRDELLLALFEEEALTGAAMLREVVGDDPGAPIERVQRCVEVLCDLVVTGSGYAAMLVREHLRLGEQYPAEMRSALAPLLDVLADELAAAADAGELRPVDRFDAATLLAVILTHVQTAILLAPEEAAPAERVWHFCRAALAPIEERR